MRKILPITAGILAAAIGCSDKIERYEVFSGYPQLVSKNCNVEGPKRYCMDLSEERTVNHSETVDGKLVFIELNGNGLRVRRKIVSADDYAKSVKEVTEAWGGKVPNFIYDNNGYTYVIEGTSEAEELEKKAKRLESDVIQNGNRKQ